MASTYALKQKSQKSPTTHEIYLYKSTQLKQPLKQNKYYLQVTNNKAHTRNCYDDLSRVSKHIKSKSKSKSKNVKNKSMNNNLSYSVNSSSNDYEAGCSDYNNSKSIRIKQMNAKQKSSTSYINSFTNSKSNTYNNTNNNSNTHTHNHTHIDNSTSINNSHCRPYKLNNKYYNKNNIHKQQQQYYPQKSEQYKKTTQCTHADSHYNYNYNYTHVNKKQKQKIQELLGISSNVHSKTSTINVEDMASVKYQSDIQSNNKTTNDQSYQVQGYKIKQQNMELLRVNQMLIYEKEYYKQKMILQEVQIRQLNRKLKQTGDKNNDYKQCAYNDRQKQDFQNIEINIPDIAAMSKSRTAKKRHNKNKSETQQSQLTFKFQIDNKDLESLSNKNRTYANQNSQISSQKLNSSYLNCRSVSKSQQKSRVDPSVSRDHSVGRSRQKKLINLTGYSSVSKSSLLVSQSEEQRKQNINSSFREQKQKQKQKQNFRIPLKNRGNTMFGRIQINSDQQQQILKTQKQFSDLLECVQNQNNLNRKTTLRKMLALKAMQLKKVKGNN